MQLYTAAVSWSTLHSEGKNPEVASFRGEIAAVILVLLSFFLQKISRLVKASWRGALFTEFEEESILVWILFLENSDVMFVSFVRFLELNGGFSLNVSSINEDIIALSRDDLKDAIRDAEVSNQRGLEEGKNPSADRIYVERQGKFYALSKRPEE
jgi:hypothetical protein